MSGDNLIRAAAVIQAASARAMIRAIGMQAENDIKSKLGQNPPFRLNDFFALIDDEAIDSNSVLEVLRG